MEPTLYSLFSESMASFDVSSGAKLAVAVSGGADSLALASLAKKWADARGHALVALVVDHGLRAEATAECEQTEGWLRAMGIVPQRLNLRMTPSDTAVQERARDARYAAMAEWCRAEAADYVLLGHHQQDQAETVLLRLLRGSAPEGLAGMSMRSERLGVCWLRPLLPVSKSALIGHLRAQGQAWVEDPSNQLMRYSRVRVRHLLAGQSPDVVPRLSELARRFAQLREKQEHALQAAVQHHVQTHDAGYVLLRREALDVLPLGLISQLLLRLLMHVNGGDKAPRSEEVLRLYEAMRSGEAKRTLHGCVVVSVAEGWQIMREACAIEEPVWWESQPWLRWDRFELTANQPVTNYRVASLGVEGWRQIRAFVPAPEGLPRAVIEALPALWHLEAVRLVPHISYRSQADDGDLQVNVRFCPAKPLAAPPFWVMNRDGKV